ncbi:E3 ubiquitin-protein ligase ATL42-like [Fagus crenata]
MRLMNQSELRQDSNIELFIQREEDHHGSSRFSIGCSFRKTERGNNNEEKQLIQEEADNSIDENQKVLHKHNHRIIVSDFVFKNRWSNLSSLDLMFLNSEMLGATSSYRFSSFDLNNDQSSALENEHIVKIKEETGMKRLFENEVNALNKTSPVSFPGLPSTSDSTSNVSQTSRYMNPTERRSMSEITALSRYEDSGMKNRIIGESSLLVNNVKAERMRHFGCQLQEEQFSGMPKEKEDLNSLKTYNKY